MKIRAVRCISLAASLSRPSRIGNYAIAKSYSTLVEVETDDGIIGVGESITRQGLGATKSLVNELLAPAVVGADPLDIDGIWTKMFNLQRFRGHSKGYFMEAISGVDTAIWDVVGKAMGLPVYKLLFGHARKDFPAYASSVLLDTPDNMTKKAVEWVKQGWKSVKVKVGQGLEGDFAACESIRKAVGRDIILTADANSAYNVAQATLLGRKLEELDFRWFEEPVPPDDLEGYRMLATKLDIPLASGESEFSLYGFKQLIESGVRIIQPDESRCGGITGARKVAILCEAMNAEYAPHTGASSAVSLMASLHLAASMPAFSTYEYILGSNPLATELLLKPIPPMKDNRTSAPDSPGLGIELDPRAVAKFTVAAG
jgi:L-alanine-DL-glutamate epimerase-like enolase superfamily enzyme